MRMTRDSLFLIVLMFCIGVASAGDLEPSAPPGPTMKSLDDVVPTWSQKLDSTDGSLVPGFEGCDSSRFECIWYTGSPLMYPRAVLDKETGLVWERTLDQAHHSWSDAVEFCYSRLVGGRAGWRLPKVEELMTLLDPSQSSPALPSGHPFLGVNATLLIDTYWTSTTSQSDASDAWAVGFNGIGTLSRESKTGSTYVMCVRGGHGYDGR